MFENNLNLTTPTKKYTSFPIFSKNMSEKFFKNKFRTENLNSHTQPLTTLTIFKFTNNQFTDIKGFGIKRNCMHGTNWSSRSNV